MKKTLTLVLAFLLVALMALPAMAATQTVNVGGGTGSLTISNSTIGQQYKLYKLFDATVSSDGKNIVYKLPAGKTLAAPATDWFTVNENGEITAKEVFTANILKEARFKTWAESFGVAMNTTTATADELVFAQLPFGYYLVESSLGTVVSVDSLTPNVTVIDKNQEPSWDNGDEKPGKVIVEGSSKVKVNEANLDEPIQFDIGVNAKNYNGEHKIYHYIIDDTLAPGMSYIFDGTHPITVKVGDTVIQPKSSTNPNGYTIKYYADGPLAGKRSGTAMTTEISPFNDQTVQSFRIEIPWTDLNSLNATADPPITAKTAAHLYPNAVEIHVNYYAKLDSAKADKVKYVDANKNTSIFNWYQDNDGDEPGGADPNHNQPRRDTETYITQIELFKYVKNGTGKVALQGAEFTLTRADESFPIYTFGTRFVPDNTNGTYWLLKDGTYTTTDPSTTGIDTSLYATPTTNKYKQESFEEVQKNATSGGVTTTVSSYVDANGKITFKGLAEGTYTISETVVPSGYNKAEDIVFKVTFDSTTKKFSSNNANVTMGQHFTVEVENKTGKELPSTGGIGTTIFYIVGALLLLGAGVVLVARRRVSGR